MTIVLLVSIQYSETIHSEKELENFAKCCIIRMILREVKERITYHSISYLKLPQDVTF